MESGTGSEVSRGVGYLDALKIVALPMASIGGIGAVILWFAADAWVRTVVAEEVASIAAGTTNAASVLQDHANKLEVHERDIGKNVEEIDEVDDKFTEFVREILAKL